MPKTALDILRGAGSLLNVHGAGGIRASRFTVPKHSDGYAVYKDWLRVGRDLHAAIALFDRELSDHDEAR